MNLDELTIKKVHESLKAGDFSVKELVDAYKKQIDEKNGEINAYLEVFDDLDKQIEEAQKRFEDGTATLLTGIPIAVKDNIMIKGKTASAASKILENYKSTYSSTAIKKLQKENPIFIGRTNMDEFAMGGSTENSAFGVTKNPNDSERVAGGSSGGSAAAVAMKGALIALGSDTGGSIRQPASFCGVVGFKPTYGHVSRSGLMAMGSSLDVIGPFANSVEDAEILFENIKGKDPLDSTSIEGSFDKEVKTIGVPREFLKEGVDEEVLKNFEESLDKLKKEGYTIKDISLPNVSYSLAVYYILMPAEVSSNMARYDGIKYGEREEGKDLVEGYFKTRGHLLGKEVKRRIMLGTYVLSAGYSDQYYNKAWQVRNLIKKNFEKAFEEVDVIATPTSPTTAFKIGEKEDPLQMYLSDIFTVPANLTGFPAISVPSGQDSQGLPFGLQFTSPALGEQQLFQVGKKFEKIK